MRKKLFFGLFVSNFLGLHGMEQKQFPELFSYAMHNIVIMPQVAFAMVQNILFIPSGTYSKRALLQYYREYKGQSWVPQGFSASIMPLKAIQYIWQVKEQIGVTPKALIYGICNIGYANESAKTLSRELLLELENFGVKSRRNEEVFDDNCYKVSVISCHYFEQTLTKGIRQVMANVAKPSVIKHWRKTLKRGRVPYILLALNPNIKTHVIMYAAPEMVILCRDFPVKLPRDFVLEDVFYDCGKQIIGHAAEAVGTIEEALNNIEAYELCRCSY